MTSIAVRKLLINVTWHPICTTRSVTRYPSSTTFVLIILIILNTRNIDPIYPSTIIFAQYSHISIARTLTDFVN